MSNYEIRETNVSKFRPFQVFNLSDGRPVNFEFATREEAQKYIDGITAMMDFNSPVLAALAETEEAWTNCDKTSEEVALGTIEEVTADEIIIAGQNEVGSIIEYKGSQWLVTACEDELIIPDDEDEMLYEVIGGWHSWLVKVQPGNKALMVVSEQVQAGKAVLNAPDSVKFPDERYAMPLSDLAYSDEIGLYQKSKFPKGV